LSRHRRTEGPLLLKVCSQPVGLNEAKKKNVLRARFSDLTDHSLCGILWAQREMNKRGGITCVDGIRFFGYSFDLAQYKFGPGWVEFLEEIWGKFQKNPFLAQKSG